MYSKTCLKQPLKTPQKLVFKTYYRLMQVKSIAECSKRAFLQYFGHALSYHLSLRSLFFLFLSGRFRQFCLFLFFFLYIPSQQLWSWWDGQFTLPHFNLGKLTGPRSAVGNVSGKRCESDCKYWGHEFDPGPVPYFRGD